VPPIRREDLDARAGAALGRRVREGVSGAAYVALVLGAAALALVIAIRFRATWDFTRASANSLSPKTVDALTALDGPVSIRGLFKDSDRRREGYWDLLQLYRRASGRVSVEIFDPNARPGALEALGLASVDRNTIKDGVSVVLAGDRKVMFRGVGEEDVTNAILEAGSSVARVVGLIRGYGERDAASTADAGLSGARDALRAEYYAIADVRLDAPIPPEITVLVAVGPQAALPTADRDRLEAWLESGGRLLVLADPAYDSGLDEVVATWGLRTRDLKVLDRRSNLRGEPEIPLAIEFTKHPIVRGFGPAMPLALPLPCAVEDFEPGDPAVYHEALARSSAYSEGLTPAGTREQGPFVLAAASYETHETAGSATTQTRVVLVGDAAFATNAFLAESSNRNFFLNCVGWLSRSRGYIALRSEPLRGQVLSLRRADRGLFQALVVGPPLLVIMAGAIVFFRRRRL